MSGSQDRIAAAEPDAPPRITRYPMFLIVWASQTISAVGVQMAAFALSIWVLQETGSLTTFGMVVAAQLLPPILLSTPAGVMVDRLDRRRVMLGCKLGSAAVSLTVFLLLLQGLLSPVTVALATAAAAGFGMVHQIAYSASVPLLVPKALYRRANGLVQLGVNLSAVAVPMIAVAMLELVGLTAILLVECACFLLAASALLVARFAPMPQRPEKSAPTLKAKLAAHTFGIRFIAGRPELLVLLLFVALTAFLTGFVNVLFRPMVLALADTAMLGTLVTVAGAGGLFGAVFVGLFLKSEDRVAPLLWFAFLSGASMVLCGLTTSYWVIGLSAFIFALCVPVILVSAQTLWQQIVPVEAQGRVFAARALASSSAMLLAVFVSPLLAETVAEPLLSGGDAGVLGQALGTGPGRGMGLLFILAGLAMTLAALAASRSAHLDRLRREADPATALTAS